MHGYLYPSLRLGKLSASRSPACSSYIPVHVPSSLVTAVSSIIDGDNHWQLQPTASLTYTVIPPRFRVFADDDIR
jgi:hypothetical protein